MVTSWRDDHPDIEPLLVEQLPPEVPPCFYAIRVPEYGNDAGLREAMVACREITRISHGERVYRVEAKAVRAGRRRGGSDGSLYFIPDGESNAERNRTHAPAGSVVLFVPDTREVRVISASEFDMRYSEVEEGE